MKNKDNLIIIARYNKLVALQSQYKDLYRALEVKYETCYCFQCKMRLVTLGMEIVSLNANIDHMERELIPSLEEIFNSMTIPYTSEEGQIKLVGK